MSLRECIAILLGSGPRGLGCMGVALGVLERQGSGFGAAEAERAFFTAMESNARTHLRGVRGLGPAGQARILAAFELGRRYARFRESRIRELDWGSGGSGGDGAGSGRDNGGTAASRASGGKAGSGRGEADSRAHPVPAPGAPARDRRISRSPLHLALERIPDKRRDDAREWLGFVPVYQRGSVGEFCLVEHGVRTHVNVEPSELFARVLALRPTGIVLFHNHPSGLLTPSLADIDLTRRVRDLASRLGIELIGHWIVTSAGEVQV